MHATLQVICGKGGVGGRGYGGGPVNRLYARYDTGVHTLRVQESSNLSVKRYNRLYSTWLAGGVSAVPTNCHTQEAYPIGRAWLQYHLRRYPTQWSGFAPGRGASRRPHTATHARGPYMER